MVSTGFCLVWFVWDRASNVVSTGFCLVCMGESIKCGKYWFLSGFTCMRESIRCGKY